MKITRRSLPIAEELIHSTGLTVTYAYDDLVFVEHNPFLLRFNDEIANQIFIHFNKDCFSSEKANFLKSIESKGLQIGLTIIEKNNYTMKPIENSEEFEIKFLDA